MQPQYNFVFSLTIFFCAFLLSTEAKTFDQLKRPCLMNDASPDCLWRTIEKVWPEFMNGIPELEIPPMDPFKVDALNLALPGGITIDIKQGYVNGLRSCAHGVRKLTVDKYEVELSCDLTLKGKYRSKGQLFMFPVDGEGQATIVSKKLKTTYTFRMGPTTNADGRKYIHLKDLQSSHVFEGPVSFDVTNLIKGSPEISKAVLGFMNENWKLVANEFGGPFVDYGTKTIFNLLKKLIESITMD